METQSDMVTKQDERKDALAAEAWRLLADLVRQLQGRYMATCSEAGLNPGALKALISLDPNEPAPMYSLAEHMNCDASMITWLVDRLEERGLVERQSSRSDRRVKLVALTEKGKTFQEQVEAQMHRPPAALESLSTGELDGLVKTLRKLRDAQGGC